MAWSNLLPNQEVSDTEAGLATQFLLKPGQTASSTGKCLTTLASNNRYYLDVSYQGGNQSNKLLRKDKWYPSTAAPICPEQVVVIQVCNENSVRDDKFDVYVNNIYIGHLDLSLDAQIGSVFLATTNIALHINSADFACPMLSMVEYKFNPSYLVYGTNTIEMRNVFSNDIGNLGTVGIRSYQVLDNNLINPYVIADNSYYGVNGMSFFFTFEYTACNSNPPYYSYSIYDGSNQPGENATCSAYNTGSFNVYSTSSPLAVSSVLKVIYGNIPMQIYDGGGFTHYYPATNSLITIDTVGVITAISSCSASYYSFNMSSTSNPDYFSTINYPLNIIIYSNVNTLVLGITVYSNTALTTPFVGNPAEYHHIDNNGSDSFILIDEGGSIGYIGTYI